MAKDLELKLRITADGSGTLTEYPAQVVDELGRLDSSQPRSPESVP